MKTIQYVQTLFYYDGPQVFEARDAIGGHYVAVMVEPENEHDRYLVTGVVPEKLREFRSGKLDLRSLMLDSGDGAWHLAEVEEDLDRPLKLLPQPSSLRESGFLPEPGFLLDPLPSTKLVLQEANGAKNMGHKSEVAEARQALYTCAISLVNNAIEHGYPLEAIALLESMIADRLEARLAKISSGFTYVRNFSTLGSLTRKLGGEKLKESDIAKLRYKAVKTWAERRNKALHQMVKLAEGDTKDWAARREEAQATAEAGLKLFRELDALVRRLNNS